MSPPRIPAGRCREALREHALRLKDSWGLQHLRLPPGAPGAARQREEKRRELEKLAGEIAACTACKLCQGRRKTVPGEGDPQARILFIGEGPGANEDRQGRPFVGAAGRLLDDIIQKGMGLTRESVFIGNVVKCRPPRNRDPQADEILACAPYLRRQIDIVEPELVITLGRVASQTILHQEIALRRLRGRVWDVDGHKVVATYHPSYLLQKPAEKRKCWEDVQLAMRHLGLPLPQRSPRDARTRRY